MLLPLRVSFRSATCQLSYSSVAMLTDSAEPSSSRMKPCCLPNWAGTGSSHVLTKRGHHLPVDSLAHGLLLDSGGLLGRRGTACASCEHKGGCGQGKKHRSSQHGFPPVVTGMRSPPCGTLRRMRSLMPSSYRALTLRVPQSHTAKHLQCLRLPFLESPSRRAHLPENKSGPRSEGLRTRKADENVEG